jgi:hypothetical protein
MIPRMTPEEAFETLAFTIDFLRLSNREYEADDLDEAYDVLEDTIADLKEEAYFARLKDDTYP